MIDAMKVASDKPISTRPITNIASKGVSIGTKRRDAGSFRATGLVNCGALETTRCSLGVVEARAAPQAQTDRYPPELR